MSAIPEEVKDIVGFIFIEDQSGKPTPLGTGFFVTVRDEINKERCFLYFVTARHVILDSSGRYCSNFLVRMNKISGGVQFMQVDLSGPRKAKVYTHSDRTVDIAVFPGIPEKDICQFKTLPEEYITTKDLFTRLQIREGDEVFFTGLFHGFFGMERNYPVVRFGRVAMVTGERIPWMGEMPNLYLIESHSFGGNSGSPVFFYLDPTRQPGTYVPGPRRLMLAGIMEGCFLERRQVQLTDASSVPVAPENMGIAAVIPAYQLHEILFSQEAREGRASAR